ncbi:hypothetical protein BV20DRAFT_964361 [Pilatotrama ljubarskyi]|nr:hypothetical protein BV20DRAFT_964361 [Pilatotrama ljubarskyi]
MPDADEYDEFYSPIDPHDLVGIEAAAVAAHALREATLSTPVQQSSQESQPEPPPSDEFDSYDFSEFTAEDFERIDAFVLARTESMQPTPIPPSPIKQPRERSGSNGGSGRAGQNGGPKVEIALEGAPKANSRRLVKGSSRRTPFQQFRQWNRVLSVTDLVGPSWCEVQFDYGLRQKRYKKLEDRPSSFVTAEGKTITVVENVAAQNDRTVTRGKSVHKVLEREVQPEAVAVEISTAEERWALRLINMLASFQALIELGYCREMPVFGAVHGQVVTGIIDEIARRPVYEESTSQPDGQTANTNGPNKRAAPHSTPSTPFKPSSKKHKPSEPTDQPPITAFFSPGKRAPTPVEPPPPRFTLHLSDTKTRIRPTLPPDEDTFASRVQLMLYHRLLSNLLSAAVPSIPASQPLDFAALWQQVDVNPSRRFSEKFLIQAGLAHSSASQADDAEATLGLHIAGVTCLNELTAAWKHAVEALHIAAVDRTLTLVYRSQPSRKRRNETISEVSRGAVAELNPQEAQDLAAAVQASVSDLQGGTGGDDDLARAIFESLKDSLRSGKAAEGDLGVLTHPFGVPISEAPGSTTLESTGTRQYSDRPTSAPGALAYDPQLAFALQQSLLPRIEESAAVKEVIADDAASSDRSDAKEATLDAMTEDSTPISEGTPLAGEAEPIEGAKTAPASPSHSDELVEARETMTVAELDVEARILGRKEFQLDDALLDRYLIRVLSWWHGERPPEGVSVELTRRCVTCEYREGCEWREKKALEAIQRYHEGSQNSQ